MKTKTGVMRASSVLVMGTLFCALLLTAMPAWSDLMIMPIRTVFQDRDRMKTITIVNTSDNSAIFRVSFFNMKQIETGGYEQLKEPLDPKYDLGKMLVFSPRQVELPPRGKQAIRLSVRRPEGLPDGEYRTHLRLDRMSGQESGQSRQIRGVSGQVGINVGFSVPVILRKGKYDASAKITDFKFVPAEIDGKRKKAQVEMYLERTGKHSTLGKLLVYWTPSGGTEKQVGILNGVNVFAETSRRRARVTLDDNAISGGKFRVVFQGADADKDKMFDEKVFPGP